MACPKMSSNEQIREFKVQCMLEHMTAECLHGNRSSVSYDSHKRHRAGCRRQPTAAGPLCEHPWLAGHGQHVTCAYVKDVFATSWLQICGRGSRQCVQAFAYVAVPLPFPSSLLAFIHLDRTKSQWCDRDCSQLSIAMP